MRTLSLLSIATLTLAACGDLAFDDGFPDGEVLKIKMPEGSQSQGLTADGYGIRQDELAGERATFYTLTRNVTKGVNTGVLWVLGMVKAITRNPPTSRDGNVRVWGPGSDPLDPNVFKLTVEHVRDQTFSYKLEGKKKAAGDDAWAVLISGEHNRSGKPGRGKGTFTLDFDQIQASIETDDATVGSITADYDASNEDKVDLAVHFRQVRDDETGGRVDAEYRYGEDAARNGTFEFAVDKSIGDTATAAREHMTIKSRWQNTGAGRSDIRATGGDLGAAEATATECWSTLFASEYLTCSWGGCNGWGAAGDCTHAGEPSYSQL